MKRLGYSLQLIFFAVFLTGLSQTVQAETSADTARKSLSANANYLKRFQKELEGLKNATDAQSTDKKQSLEKKIKNLEIENARLTGLVGVKAVPTKAAPADAKPVVVDPSGSSALDQWDRLSREEKEVYVKNKVEIWRQEGHTIERHPLFYTALMDYVFVADPSLASKPLADALLVTIKKNEPAFNSSR